MSEIRIFKFAERRLYAKIPNYAAQDPRITFGAKGVLTYLLSLPNDFVIYKKQIIKKQKSTRKMLDKFFVELENFGYLVEDSNLDRLDGKFSGKNYRVYPVPNNKIDLIYSDSPMYPEYTDPVPYKGIGSEALKTQEIDQKQLNNTKFTDVPGVHRSSAPVGHCNEKTPYSILKETNNKLEIAKQVLGVVDELRLKYGYKNNEHFPLKLNDERRSSIIARQKEFHQLWGHDRDFIESCAFTLEYKAREWSGTDQWKYFTPETLFQRSKFTKYCEAAKANKGTPKLAQNDLGPTVVTNPDAYHKKARI